MYYGAEGRSLHKVGFFLYFGKSFHIMQVETQRAVDIFIDAVCGELAKAFCFHQFVAVGISIGLGFVEVEYVHNALILWHRDIPLARQSKAKVEYMVIDVAFVGE